MTERLKPENTLQIIQAIKWAVAEKSPLEVRAGGSKQSIGRPMMDNFQLLDIAALNGITYYKPEELVLSAWAATPMADIRATLSEKNQQLAFEPPDYREVLGSTSTTPTLGGTLACNLGGPRRIQAGAARVHFLPILKKKIMVNSVCLFYQTDKNSQFELIKRFKLGENGPKGTQRK